MESVLEDTLARCVGRIVRRGPSTGDRVVQGTQFRLPFGEALVVLNEDIRGLSRLTVRQARRRPPCEGSCDAAGGSSQGEPSGFPVWLPSQVPPPRRTSGPAMAS